MAKVILVCGKLCCGKTTYANEFCAKHGAVLLSVDEIMLALFGQHCGEEHDKYAGKTQRYLFEKSLQILENNADIVLDWGFWTKEARQSARKFYESRNIPCELHYMDISENAWRARIQKRNLDVSDGMTQAYFVDELLLDKLKSRFEVPDREEIDIYIKSEQERTEEKSGRLPKEIRVYDRLDHEPAMNMEICRAIDEALLEGTHEQGKNSSLVAFGT